MTCVSFGFLGFDPFELNADSFGRSLAMLLVTLISLVATLDESHCPGQKNWV
jgi:hypothetical protein